MAVTDLTDSLPWWARNGSGSPQGPGAVGTTSAAPQGAGGQPGGADWLQYLAQMYGISPQQAMAMMQSGGSSLPMAASMQQDQQQQQVPPDDHGDRPPDTTSPRAMYNLGNPPAPVNPPGPGNVAPVPLSNGAPPVAASVQQPPQQSPGPPVGAGMLDQSGVQRGPMGVLRTQPGASAPVGAGLLDQSGVGRNPAGVLTPGAASPASAAAAPAAPPVPGPLASGGASAVGATSNPRFVSIDRPNADPTARRGSPQMTALNLAGLFGRGQPAVNPNAPAANAQPVSAQRPVPGPLANAPMPPVMPGDIRNQRVKNAIANPNWWQNL